MEVSKIHLSAAEMELVQNEEIILTKNRILEKIKLMLEEVQQRQLDLIGTIDVSLRNEIFKVLPKISKGENYLGLPYLVLDYPRQSTSSHFFFIRTMFWWGNFFSCTLHLAKDSKKLFKEKLRQSQTTLGAYYINIGHDPWVHHLQESNFRKINSLTAGNYEEACENYDHIKIAGRHPLTEWEKIPSELVEDWNLFLSVCGVA